MENSEERLVRKLKFDELEDTLVYFATSILNKNTKEEILWDLAKNCISRLGFVDCVIYEADHERRVLVQKAAYGPKNPRDYELLKPIEIGFGEGITGSVVMSGKAECVSDTTKDERYIVDDESRLSEITVPIIIHDRVWGIIDCEHPEKNYFTSQHLKILAAIASICAVKLARVRVQQELMDKQNALLDMQKELLNLRVNSLRRQMNPHFLFNALNAIQYFITSNKKEDALRYHSLFSKLIRKYLVHLDEDMVVLEEELRMTEWYLQLQMLRYDGRFRYNVEIDNSFLHLPVPALIIQLVIEDLVEGMVMSNSGEGDLSLVFKKEKYGLEFGATLEVSEAHAFQRKTNIDYRSDLLNWPEYIDLLNRLKNTHIKRGSQELYNEGQEEIGRRVELFIPF